MESGGTNHDDHGSRYPLSPDGSSGLLAEAGTESPVTIGLETHRARDNPRELRTCHTSLVLSAPQPQRKKPLASVAP